MLMGLMGIKKGWWEPSPRCIHKILSIKFGLAYLTHTTCPKYISRVRVGAYYFFPHSTWPSLEGKNMTAHVAEWDTCNKSFLFLFL
jgi:hypothetical protein